MIVGPHSTKLPQSWDTGSDQPSVPAFTNFFSVMGRGNPRTTVLISIIWTFSCTVFAIWDLRGFIYLFIWIYACAPQSNIQLRRHRPTLETSGKGFRITSLPALFFMVILMNTSWRTPLIHDRFWFCMQGIQFPLDHFMYAFPTLCVCVCLYSGCLHRRVCRILCVCVCVSVLHRLVGRCCLCSMVPHQYSRSILVIQNIAVGLSKSEKCGTLLLSMVDGDLSN